MKKTTKKTETAKAKPGYRVRVKAEEGLEFRITPEDVKLAECKNPNCCVIAVAVKRAIGPVFEEIEVGSTVTKIMTRGEVISFTTPHNLSRALRVFDNTEVWPLKPGVYALKAYDKSRNRLDVLHKSRGKWKGKKTQFAPIGGGRATRTRQVRRVEMLCAV